MSREMTLVSEAHLLRHGALDGERIGIHSPTRKSIRT